MTGPQRKVASSSSSSSSAAAAVPRVPSLTVAGFGFRSGATWASLHDALVRALAAAGSTTGLQDIALLATAHDKADAPCVLALAAELRLPLCGVSANRIAAARTITRSPVVHRLRGTGSTAEAAALAAVSSHGDIGAMLSNPRAISADRLATCAIATLITSSPDCP